MAPTGIRPAVAGPDQEEHVTSPRDDEERQVVDPDMMLGNEAAPGGTAGAQPARPDAPGGSPRGRRVQLAILAAVATGGAFGAVSRYAISLAIPETASGFPWATFLINVTGSAVLGFLVTLILEQFPRGRLARPLLGTGFIGAYTTFSTFTVEAVLLVRAGHPATAGAYVLASVVAGLAAAWAGMIGARLIVAAERWIQQAG
jgi:fluoride exporter